MRRSKQIISIVLAAVLTVQPSLGLLSTPAAVRGGQELIQAEASENGRTGLKEKWDQLMSDLNKALDTLNGRTEESWESFSEADARMEKAVINRLEELAEGEREKATRSNAEEADGAMPYAYRAASETSVRAAQSMPSGWSCSNNIYTANGTVEPLTLTTGEYHFGNINASGAAGKSPVIIKGSVTLYIDGNVTLTGGNASGRTGAGAGIELTDDAILMLQGSGRLTCAGGNAAAGGSGADADTSGAYVFGGPNKGGRGGDGGGGAGAGIGGRGGNGGEGGLQSEAKGADGSPGAMGGNLFVYGTLESISVSGGREAGGGSGGDGANGYSFTLLLYMRMKSGAGGGGGGGGGYAAAPIGGGGAGGGGGNAGEDGLTRDFTPLEFSGDGFLPTLMPPLAGGSSGTGSQNGGGGGGGAATIVLNPLTVLAGSGGDGGAPGNNGDASNVWGLLSILGWGIEKLLEVFNVGVDTNLAKLIRDGGMGYCGQGGGGGLSSRHGLIARLSTATSLNGNQIDYGRGSDFSTVQGNQDRQEYSTIYDLSTLSVEVVPNQVTYNKSPQTPEVVVKAGGAVVSPALYMKEYNNNINAGKASVRVYGSYDFSKPLELSCYGVKTAEFTIDKAIPPVEVSSVERTPFGSEFVAAVGGNEGHASVAFEIVSGTADMRNLSGDGSVAVTPREKGPLVLRASVSETANYMSATATKQVEITGKSLESATILPIGPQRYTGKELRPEVTVYLDGKELNRSTDYQVTYESNIDAGTALVKVEGIGNYDGKDPEGKKVVLETKFTILPRSINDASVTSDPIADVLYDATSQTPDIRVHYRYADVTRELVKGLDYETTYYYNKDAGSGMAVLQGIGNFNDIRQVRFQILPRDIGDSAVTAEAIENAIFSGLKQEPLPALIYKGSDGTINTLRKGADFDLVYSNNLYAGTAMITVKGKNNFKGERSLPFTIAPKPLKIQPQYHTVEAGVVVNPEFSYGIEGMIKGYEPVIAGSFIREKADEFELGKSYLIYENPGDRLRLDSGSSLTNQKNYVIGEVGTAYLSVNASAFTAEEAYPAVMEDGTLVRRETGDGALDPDDNMNWYRSQVYLTAPDDYEISSSNALADNEWRPWLTYPDGDYMDIGVTYFLRNKNTGAISQAKTIKYKQDTLAPEGNVIVEDFTWSGFAEQDDIYYSDSFRVKPHVTVYGVDTVSGVPQENDAGVQTGVKYYIADRILKKEQLTALDDSEWNYGFEFDFPAGTDTDQKGVIYVCITDRAGNQSYFHTDGIMYDTTAPVIQITGQPPVHSWTSVLVPAVTGFVTEQLSGLKDRYVTYTVEREGELGGYPHVLECAADGSFSILLADLEDGKYVITLRAEDEAGNIADTVSVPLWIDRTPPVVSDIAVSPGQNGEWQKENITILPVLERDTSGIASVEYSLDGGAVWIESREADFHYTITQDGVYDAVLVRVTDKNQNRTITRKGRITAKKDSLAPLVPEVLIKGSSFSEDADGNTWYKGSESPMIQIADPPYTEKEAPTKSFWKLWKKGENEPADWSEGAYLSLPDTGIWMFKYYGEDDAKGSSTTGNQSAQKTMEIRWDNEAPVFGSLTDPSVPIFEYRKINTGAGARIANSLTFGTFFGEAVSVKVHVEDSGGSGLKRLTYQLNGTEEQDISLVSKAFDLELNTSGTIALRAYDGAGNVTRTLMMNLDGSGNVVVENEPPEIHTAVLSVPNQNGWYREVKIAVTAYDEESGLASIQGQIGADTYSMVLNQAEALQSKVIEASLTEDGMNQGYSLEVSDNVGLTARAEADGFQIDNTPPLSMAAIHPVSYVDASGAAQSGIPDVTDQNITFDIEAADTLSGIDRYSLSYDGGTTWTSPISWDGSKKEIVVSEEGTYAIQVRVWDKADNTMTAEAEKTITISRVKPEKPTYIITPGEGGSYNAETGWYNGKEPVIRLLKKQEADLLLTKLADGMVPDDEMDTITNTDSRLLFWNKTTDEMAESAVTLPRDDWGEITGANDAVYGNPVEGCYKLWYTVADSAGRTCENSVETIRWDNTAPAVSDVAFHEAGGGRVSNFFRYGSFAKTDVVVEFRVKDPFGDERSKRKDGTYSTNAVSGIDTVEYYIDGKGPYQAVQDGSQDTDGFRKYYFEIPTGTRGMVSLKVKDLAGNESSEYVFGAAEDGSGSERWIVEAEKPVIGELSAKASEMRQAEDGTMWYREDIELSSIITDSGSGLKTVKYALWDEEPVETDYASGPDDLAVEGDYTWTKRLSAEGNPVQVTLAVTDQSGNESTKTWDLYLDKTKPEADLEFRMAEAATASDWSQGNILAFTAEDPAPSGSVGSGVMDYFWSMDRGASFAGPITCRDGAEQTIMLPDGMYEKDDIVVRVRDTAGNVWDSRLENADVEKRIDTVAPESALLTVSADNLPVTEYSDEAGWYSGASAPKLQFTKEEADRNRAPVHVYWCIVPETEHMPALDSDVWEKDGEPVISGEGAWTVYWYTEDEAGNTSDKAAPNKRIVRYDRSEPVYTDERGIFTAAHRNRSLFAKAGSHLSGGNFFKEAVRFTLYPVDTPNRDASGTAAAFYSLDGANTWISAKAGGDGTYFFDLTKSVDGLVSVTVKTVDKAGNESEEVILKGELDSTGWAVDERKPVISPITAIGARKNADGWYQQHFTAHVVVRDEDTGVGTAVIMSEAGNKASKEPKKVLKSVDYTGYSPVSTREEILFELAEDCTGLRLTAELTDLGGNKTTRIQEPVNIDTVKPVFASVNGWPSQMSGAASEITVVMEDERSGFDSGIRAPQELVSLEVDGEAQDFTCRLLNPNRLEMKFTAKQPGLYRIVVSDLAGNTEVYTRDEHNIDISTVEEGYPKVSVSPANYDGMAGSGWYVTIPKIHITPLRQQEEAVLSTWFTVTPEGDPEGEPVLAMQTTGIGTDGTEQHQVREPEIPGEGIWKLHVWTVNDSGARSDYRRTIKVDLNGPETLKIIGAYADSTGDEARDPVGDKRPEVTVSSTDNWSGVSKISYSTDGGDSWYGWRDFSGSGKLKIKEETADTENLMIRVMDAAGNISAIDSYTVEYDTTAPYLEMRDPLKNAINVGQLSVIRLQTTEPVKEGIQPGTLRIFEYETGELFCEVRASSNPYEINRRDCYLDVKLPKPLKPGTRYYLDITEGFVRDLAGNRNEYCGGYGIWEFTTAGVSTGLMQEAAEHSARITAEFCGNLNPYVKTEVMIQAMGPAFMLAIDGADHTHLKVAADGREAVYRGGKGGFAAYSLNMAFSRYSGYEDGRIKTGYFQMEDPIPLTIDIPEALSDYPSLTLMKASLDENGAVSSLVEEELRLSESGRAELMTEGGGYYVLIGRKEKRVGTGQPEEQNSLDSKQVQEVILALNQEMPNGSRTDKGQWDKAAGLLLLALLGLAMCWYANRVKKKEDME